MIYFIQAGLDGEIKIGFTDKDDPLDRLRACQTGNPKRLRLLGTMPGTKDDEDALHMRFAAFKTMGEGGKEWFQPVPELAAIIPVNDLPSCGKIEVVEQSVSIRVLTVGRKQFSAKLLEQLPRRQPIDWFDLVDQVYRGIPTEDSIADYLKSFDLGDHVNGNVWGWLKGEYSEAQHSVYRWVLFVDGGRLFKYRDFDELTYDQVPQLDVPKGSYGYVDLKHPTHVFNSRLLKIGNALNALRKKLPGWRDEDQLFFGV